jgi:aldehyde dehydrogenase (NAD+)
LSLVKRAAERALPCQTEMGGSNPTVVLADADLPRAVARETTVSGPVIGEAALGEALDALGRTGGRVLSGGSADRSTNVLSPALVEVDADRPDVLLSQEVFAPVAALVRADDPIHAMAIAADTPYGLSAGLFTANVRAVLDFLRDSEVGMVRVNAPTTGVDFWAPFGGMKASSFGSREQGPAAKDFFTHGVTVFIDG